MYIMLLYTNAHKAIAHLSTLQIMKLKILKTHDIGNAIFLFEVDKDFQTEVNHTSKQALTNALNSLTQGCQTQILSRANYALGFGLERYKFLKYLVA